MKELFEFGDLKFESEALLALVDSVFGVYVFGEDEFLAEEDRFLHISNYDFKIIIPCNKSIGSIQLSRYYNHHTKSFSPLINPIPELSSPQSSHTILPPANSLRYHTKLLLNTFLKHP